MYLSLRNFSWEQNETPTNSNIFSAYKVCKFAAYILCLFQGKGEGGRKVEMSECLKENEENKKE